MDIGGGGNVFDLQGTISVDTSSLDSDLQSAIDSADELQSAINGISDNVDVDVTVDDDNSVEGDVSEVNSEIDSIDSDVDVEVTVDGDGSAQSDAQEVADAVSSIGDQGSSAGTNIEGLANTITSILGGAAVATAISGVYNSIKDLVNATTTAGDTIDKQSDQLGLTRKEYQEWDYIMQLCGSDVSTMGRMVNKLTDPTDDATAALQGMGINMTEFSEMSRGDQFATVMKGLQGITDTTERQNTAQQIFGNQWKNVATLMEQSPEYIDECKQTMEELGMYMSDDDVDAAATFSDSMTTLNSTISSLKNDIVADILPTLTSFFDGISGTVGAIHSIFDTLSDPTFPETLETIGASFQETIATINSQDVNATSIISALAELSNQESLTDEQVQEWNTLKDQLSAILPGIGDLFGDEAGEINGGVDALIAHKDALIADMKAQAAAEAEQEKLNALAAEAAKLTDLQVEANVQQGIADSLRENAGSNLLEAASMMGEDYVDALTTAVNNNTDEFGNVDWTSAAAEAGMFQEGDVEMRLDPEEQAQYMALLASATTDVATAEQNAAAAQEALAEGQIQYDEQAAATQQWIDSLNEIYGTEQTTAEGTATSASSIESSTSGMTSSVDSDLTTMATTAQTECDKFNAAVSSLKSKKVTISVNTSSDGTPHATGSDFIPYDNYPAILHKGEMVLTSLEAKNYRNGNGNGSGLSAESMTAMANVIAGAVASRPISFGVDSHELAVRTRDENSRQTAVRSKRISSGYGRGGNT